MCQSPKQNEDYIFKMKRFFILLLVIWLASCNSSKQSENAPTSESKQKYIVDIYAKRDNTKLSTKITKPEKDKAQSTFVSPIKIEFNGKLIEEKSFETSEEIAFKYSAESYQEQNQFTITDTTGNTCNYDVALEALDFSKQRDVILSRTETNILPLSRVEKEDEEWWLFFRENEGGGFKEIAEFTEQRNSLILPPRWTKRLWVGNVVIELATGVFKDINKPDCPEAKIHLQYSSEIPAKVVKQF